MSAGTGGAFLPAWRAGAGDGLSTGDNDELADGSRDALRPPFEDLCGEEAGGATRGSEVSKFPIDYRRSMKTKAAV